MKHGYVDTDEKTKAISRGDYDRKIDDMIQQRAQEDLDMPENLFEGRNFNPREFHKAFEKKKKRDEKRGKKRNGEIVKINGDDGIMAFNDGVDSQFASVNALDTADLYANGKYDGAADTYAGVGAGMYGNNEGSDSGEISISSEDIRDNYDESALSKQEMDRRLQEAIAERNTQNTMFEKMEQRDYGSALDDKYGVSNQFGFMVGDNKFGHQVGRGKDKKSKTTKTEYEAYKELTME